MAIPMDIHPARHGQRRCTAVGAGSANSAGLTGNALGAALVMSDGLTGSARIGVALVALTGGGVWADAG